MKTKMRIKLLSPELVTLSDRLVDQTLEFTNGPQEKHKGPLTLEVTLRDNTDVEGLKLYIDKLLGDLPIAEKRKYDRSKKGTTQVLDAEPAKELVMDIKKLYQSQEEIIEKLRAVQFVFMDAQHVLDLALPVEFKEVHKKKFQFLVRQLKKAKNPKADKFDPQVLVGIKIIGKRIPYIVIYLYGKYYAKFNKPWKGKDKISFNKSELTVFPYFMTLDEREKWRFEHRLLSLDKEKKPSKFYLRWKPYIKTPS
jgi:hypothetical protein